MGMTRESKLKNAFATPLLNNINNEVTELKVSKLSFKHMFNEKEPITEHKIIKVLPSFSGKHCLFFKIGHFQSHFVISFGVIVTKTGKSMYPELISGRSTLHRFFSSNVYGNGVESIWRDIMNVYEYRNYIEDKVFSGIFI